jgi:uncharacterized membrane protein YeiH
MVVKGGVGLHKNINRTHAAACQEPGSLRLSFAPDAIGLALFSVTGAEIALSASASPAIAIAMGVATATLGGVIRDILGGEIPIILRREIYVTAAFAGSGGVRRCMAVGTGEGCSLGRWVCRRVCAASCCDCHGLVTAGV